MKRRFSNLLAGISLLLCVGVCVLWFRGRTGTDELSLTYDRWLPDRGAASNQLCLTSDRRLWLNVSWGKVGPYNGQLVRGYYVNADNSGGRPRLRAHHESFDPLQIWLFHHAAGSNGSSGLSPVRWVVGSRTKAKDGDDFRFLSIGIPHWLAALLLLVWPTLWLRRFRKEQMIRARHFCPVCGYDLRESPERCPECGRPRKTGGLLVRFRFQDRPRAQWRIDSVPAF